MSSHQTQLLSSQLEGCVHDFRHLIEEARNLLTHTEESLLLTRPSRGQWSPLECVEHLNLANRAMLPGIQQAVEAAPAPSELVFDCKYKMDLAGRLLAWSLEPPVFIKLKAPKMAAPAEAAGDLPMVLAEFEQLHQEFIRLLHSSAGKLIDRQKMKSPFANMHYNTYSAFRIIAAHDRRHLWQARKILSY
jgi:hypothetical protein